MRLWEAEGTAQQKCSGQRHSKVLEDTRDPPAGGRRRKKQESEQHGGKTWLHELSKAKKRGTYHKLRHGNWVNYNLLYRMFCVAEKKENSCSHFWSFCDNFCSQIYVCAYYQIWLSKCSTHSVSRPCLYQLNVNEQIKINFCYVTLSHVSPHCS